MPFFITPDASAWHSYCSAVLSVYLSLHVQPLSWTPSPRNSAHTKLLSLHLELSLISETCLCLPDYLKCLLPSLLSNVFPLSKIILVRTISFFLLPPTVYDTYFAIDCIMSNDFIQYISKCVSTDHPIFICFFLSQPTLSTRNSYTSVEKMLIWLLFVSECLCVPCSLPNCLKQKISPSLDGNLPNVMFHIWCTTNTCCINMFLSSHGFKYSKSICIFKEHVQYSSSCHQKPSVWSHHNLQPKSQCQTQILGRKCS